MSAFETDFGPISIGEDGAEIGWLIETDDGTPYEYEGNTLRLEVGNKRSSDGGLEPVFVLTSEDGELEFRTDGDDVYPVATLPQSKIADASIEAPSLYDLYCAGGGGETDIAPFNVRIFTGTLQFVGNVVE